jgi:CspA family cold shock protein
MSNNKDVVTTVAAEHLVGRVKWFNSKAGYGFITVTDGPRSGTDIFVHHSGINVVNQQYRYLVQGEYVDFDLVKTDSTQHEWQAYSVSGIRGGKLMCETRYELRQAKNEYRASKRETTQPTRTTETPVQSEVTTTSSPTQRQPRQRNATNRVPRTRDQNDVARTRGEGPRSSENNNEWKLAGTKKQTKLRSRAPRQVASESQ